MLSGFEVYLFDELTLEEGVCKEFDIKRVNGAGLMYLLNQYKRILKVNREGYVIGDVKDMKQEFMSEDFNSRTFFYVEKRHYIEVLDVDRYYGISYNGEVIGLYKDENVRNAKLNLAYYGGIDAIREENSSSKELVDQMNYQKKLSLAYKKLGSHVYKHR